MTEQTPLLGGAPAALNVSHAHNEEMGVCYIDGTANTRGSCFLCHNYVCQVHRRSQYVWHGPHSTAYVLPCIASERYTRTCVGETCLNCYTDQGSMPEGYPRNFVIRPGPTALCVLMTIVIIVAGALLF